MITMLERASGTLRGFGSVLHVAGSLSVFPASSRKEKPLTKRLPMPQRPQGTTWTPPSRHWLRLSSHEAAPRAPSGVARQKDRCHALEVLQRGRLRCGDSRGGIVTFGICFLAPTC